MRCVSWRSGPTGRGNTLLRPSYFSTAIIDRVLPQQTRARVVAIPLPRQLGSYISWLVLSGLVWNAPTSCAWASHVFVDRRSAVSHGRRVFGLPSRLSTIRQRRAVQGGGEVVAVESGGGPIVELRRKARPSALKGPKISFQLPSFSGRTKHKPDLLKYDLDLSATIQPCAGYEVSLPASRGSSKAGSALAAQVGSILSGKMLASLSFKNMSMHVKRPEVFAKNEKKGSAPIGVPKRRRAGSAKISSVQT